MYAATKCANPRCEIVFEPRRLDHRFHTKQCRLDYWHESYHFAPHPCPLCTVEHDPEEAAILSALEMLLATQSHQGVIALSDLREFIDRRRRILTD